MLESVSKLLNSRTGSIIKVLVSCSILFIFFFTIDYEKLSLLISGFNYTYLVLLFALIILGNFLAAVRFHFLISVSKKIRIYELMRQYYIASFFNNFLPTAIGGDAVRMFLVSKFGIPKTIAAFFIIMERLIGLYSLILIAFLSSFFWKVPHQIKTLILILICGYTLLMIAIFSRRMALVFKTFKVVMVDRITNHIQLLRAGKTIIPVTFILSACYQLISIAISYCVAAAISLHIPVFSFLTLVPLVWLFTMIPISFGGLGLREASFIYLLSLIDIPKEGALVVSLGTYGTLVIGGIIGMVFFMIGRLRDIRALETNSL